MSIGSQWRLIWDSAAERSFTSHVDFDEAVSSCGENPHISAMRIFSKGAENGFSHLKNMVIWHSTWTLHNPCHISKCLWTSAELRVAVRGESWRQSWWISHNLFYCWASAFSKAGWWPEDAVSSCPLSLSPSSCFLSFLRSPWLLENIAIHLFFIVSLLLICLFPLAWRAQVFFFYLPCSSKIFSVLVFSSYFLMLLLVPISARIILCPLFVLFLVFSLLCLFPSLLPLILDFQFP